jgi:hypothetical protein
VVTNFVFQRAYEEGTSRKDLHETICHPHIASMKITQLNLAMVNEFSNALAHY